MTLEIGTLIRWDHFAKPRYGTEIKARWFIYLGETGTFTQVSLIYLATTTTQMNHFQTGATRSGHSHFKFETRQFNIFDDDCVLDFDDPPYAIEKANFLNMQADITVKGQLDEQTLRMIYNRFLKSGACSKMVMLDIHNSFNSAGITGLKKPK